MRVYLHTKSIFYGFFNPLNTRVAEFYDFVNLTIRSVFIDNQMIVLLVEIGFFIRSRR